MDKYQPQPIHFLVQHWEDLGDICESARVVADDLSNGNEAAIDEAIELLLVLAHKLDEIRKTS